MYAVRYDPGKISYTLAKHQSGGLHIPENKRTQTLAQLAEVIAVLVPSQEPMRQEIRNLGGIINQLMQSATGSVQQLMCENAA